jgi:hypothetical protein
MYSLLLCMVCNLAEAFGSVGWVSIQSFKGYTHVPDSETYKTKEG